MKPRKSGKTPQDQLFRVRLIDIVNEDHELVRLAKVIDWQSLDGAVANHFAVAGAPALPSRLVLGLMYLQHLHKLSDEAVLYRFVESPYYRVPRTPSICRWSCAKDGSLASRSRPAGVGFKPPYAASFK